MSTKAAHTDLPWSSMIAGTSEGKEYFEISGMNSIYWIAKVRYQMTGNSASLEELAEGKANADLIVRAVNHHDDLVTRLYNLVNVLDTVLPDKDEDAHGILEAVVFARNEARETLSKIIK